MFELHEIPLERSFGPIAKPVWEFIEQGLQRGKSIACFDYVPSIAANPVIIPMPLPHSQNRPRGSASNAA